MRRIRTLLLTGAMVVGATASVSLVGVQAANAAGSGYSGKAVYQITISSTCSNVTACGADNLGGFWGWIALYGNGTGDGQLTFCGHGAAGSGAGHEALDIGQWTISDGTFVFSDSSDPHFDGPTPIPATPGHYNLNSGPGVEMQVTVALNPTA